MPSVRLLPLDHHLESVLASGDAAFAERYDILLGSHLESTRTVVRESLTFLASRPRPDPWGCYLSADLADGSIVGSCGFKHGPDADGAVEIAYYTVPDRQCGGYATAMTESLFELSVKSGDVRTVIAHTLPEMNASGRVLEKAGFRKVGDVEDPNDGRVWRWERPTTAARPDDEFLAAFEAGTLPKCEWTHPAHVRVAWLYLCRHPFEDALARVRAGIHRYNATVGTPAEAYHDTVTVGYLHLIRAAGVDPAEGFDAFGRRNPVLLDRTLAALLGYYTRDRLFSPDARALFVGPDVQPLPAAPE